MSTENTPTVDVAVVLGFIAVKEITSVEKKVAILSQLGFTNSQMEKICDATPGVIRTLKSKARRSK